MCDPAKRGVNVEFLVRLLRDGHGPLVLRRIRHSLVFRACILSPQMEAASLKRGPPFCFFIKCDRPDFIGVTPQAVNHALTAGCEGMIALGGGRMESGRLWREEVRLPGKSNRDAKGTEACPDGRLRARQVRRGKRVLRGWRAC